MGLFKNIKQGLDAARNPPSQAEIEQSLQYLTPEQRARYDAQMVRVAEAQGEAQAAHQEALDINQASRVLEGPAGQYLYGTGMAEYGTPEAMQARIAEVGVLQATQEMRAVRKGELRTAVKQTFNMREVPLEKDPVRAQQIYAEEHAARDAARAPYRASDAVPVTIDRVATRGGTQVPELLAHLARTGIAGQPHRVYGVYRVPDRISQALTPHSEKGRVVEWDVVHAPLDPASSVPEPRATSFAAGDQWVARRLGEPSILDEDLGIAFLMSAGIEPEQSLGVARYCEFRTVRGNNSGGEDGADPLMTLVRGVLAVHPGDAAPTFEQMRAAAPLQLPAQPAGVWAEVLNWGEVARAVRPKIHHPPPTPSPFPYLPSTPQELLLAYLEVVGLRADDCYSAQCTVDDHHQLVQGGMFTTNLGPKQPCADGKDRMRSHGCQQVVLAYRDRPEYAEGRARWAAYQADVLQADLRKGTGVRRPLAMPPDIDEVVPVGLRSIARIADSVDRMLEWGIETVPAYRYSWPPVG